MSKGPGAIERRIADLFAATRDRALSIDEIARHAFVLKGRTPTRAQRLSATRATHRLLRRVREAYERMSKSDDKAEREKLYDFASWIGLFSRIMRGDRRDTLKVEADFWQAITLKGRLYFHPPDIPLQVWAVTMDRAGVHWFNAELIKITARNVVVRYRGATARLDREKLWYWWAWWRGVMFVSSRTGRIANALDERWRRRYGAAGSVPPSMQMPLDQAMALLGVPADYTRDDVIAGFRRAAKKAHPDAGGTAEMFRLLVEARDRLLAALGTSAPAPKAPEYAPTGTQMVYRTGRRASNRLASDTRQLT
jgi:curved DNA-binding protein CbpA